MQEVAHVHTAAGASAPQYQRARWVASRQPNIVGCGHCMADPDPDLPAASGEGGDIEEVHATITNSTARRIGLPMSKQHAARV
jgi:hypothetical protein